MKKSLLIAAAALCSLASQAEGVGVYITGSMNNWNNSDPAWEFQLEEDTPGWAYIDISSLPAGTEFRIVGPDGREYGMKNTRNTIRQNSLHLMTLNGTYNLVAADGGLDGVHLMLQYGEFFTDKYIGIITRNADSELLYGACDAESVTPTLLPRLEQTDNYSAMVNLTQGWYVIKAYQLSNATQTVCSYAPAAAGTEVVAGTPLQLTATSNLTPTLSPISVPTSGAGEYSVNFNAASNTLTISNSTGIGETITTTDEAAEYFSLEGIRLNAPEGICIERRGTKARLIAAPRK